MIKEKLSLLNASRFALRLKLLPAGLTDAQNSAQNVEHRNAAINAIVAVRGKLPALTFPEEHPYKNTYPINNNYDTYIIGTFPPISYLLDNAALAGIPNLIPLAGNKILQPDIPFYHGNECTFWKLLNPALIPNPIGNRNNVVTGTVTIPNSGIVGYLNLNRVNYFDVIDECQRKKYDSSDKNLINIIPNNSGINSVLNNNSSDVWLIFNTSSSFNSKGLVFYKKTGLFNPSSQSFDIFLFILIQLGITVEFSLDKTLWFQIGTLKGNSWIATNLIFKLVFYMRINNKVVTVITGPSPSTAAWERAYGTHPKYTSFLKKRLGNNLNDFKSYVYKNAITKNLAALTVL